MSDYIPPGAAGGPPPSSLPSDDGEGGFDEEFVSPLDDRYRCPVCTFILREPRQTGCGHRYCNYCITITLKEPTPTCPIDGEELRQDEVFPDLFCIREILMSKVYCRFKKNGCQEILLLRNLEAHVNECEYAIIDCIFKEAGCIITLQRRHLPHHLDSECNYRQEQCSFCGELVAVSQLEDHEGQVCANIPVVCPNNCGTTNIQRAQLEEHFKVCPVAEAECSFSSHGCPFKGRRSALQDHESQSMTEHFELVTRSLSSLELEHSRTKRELQEKNNETELLKEKVKQQEAEVASVKQSHSKQEAKIAALQKMMASQTDRQINIEQGLGATAKKEEVDQQKRELASVKEQVKRVDIRVNSLESRGGGASSSKGDAFSGVLETQLNTHDRQLGIHDVRLAEMDLRFQILETTSFDGTLLWKIKDYTRRKHDAVTGRTLSLYSQPFYTSQFGYKMCARVYLNGDGMGKGTHMSLFFVVMRGEYDALLPWPFRQKVTLMLLDQDQGRRHLSDTFRPDPTSSSFKRPTSDMNIASGCPLFVSQSVAESKTYLNEDTIFIKVIVDCSDLVSP
uniref:Tumor necrosis factor receptor-associated factor 3 n=1 Tax=Branchiostoma belcheri TaxID=7741 RepID=A2TK68_BRABE|nr:tumor necrosis factor receptor-associated factor 3 [Branchiostoma belcheri]